MHSRDSHAYQNNFSTIRNTAEAIFEWHAYVACRWTLVVGELDLHGEQREKLVEKAMFSVRLDGFLGKKNIKHGNFGKQFR